MASLAMTRFYKPTGPFVYSSKPKPVQHRKYTHVSIDNKFFLKNEESVLNSNKAPLLSSYSSFMENRGKTQASTLSRSRTKSDVRTVWKGGTPEPVEGRSHMQMQTEMYLEEMADVVQEQDQSCQTDCFLERPATPLFMPCKTGVDQETQIFEGDLFDFDVESKPIVDVLVGKVLEQSLLEVIQEEELASLKERQKMFEEARAVELQEEQRLEEEEKRRKKEKLERMKQQQEVLKKHRETAQKVAAKAFSEGFLADLVPQVITSLTTHGFFTDPVEMEVERELMEDLMRGVSKRLRQEVVARMLVDQMVREVLVNREVFFLNKMKEEVP